jgi:S1-C subfamily serine protease
MSRARFCTPLAAASLGLALALTAGQAADPKPAVSPDRLQLPPNAPLGATPAQLAGLLEPAVQPDKGPLKPAPREGRPKGFEDLYPRVAPAVVVVRTEDGHGTGFLVHADGWVLTNHHVVRGARADPATGALRVLVFVGELVDGEMRLVPEGVPALVYKTSPAKDLALLKLTVKPPRPAKLPVLVLSDKEPVVGRDCVAVGHPAAGLLWTLRSGIVSQKGRWPEEMTDLVAATLGVAAAGPEHAELKELLRGVEKRKVLLSTCGLNPGDSGGPLVDRDGRVIAVSFAVPQIDKERQVDLARFSYHVHLDEVRAFLADREKLPAQAPPDIPDVMPRGVRCALADMDSDGTPETLLFGVPRTPLPTGLLLDLKESNGRLTAADLADPDKRARWKFQFALHRQPHPTAFYATSGEGPPDLILRDFDGDGKADLQLRFDGKSWHPSPGDGQDLIDPKLFTDRDLQAKFRPFAAPFRRMLKPERRPEGRPD